MPHNKRLVPRAEIITRNKHSFAHFLPVHYKIVKVNIFCCSMSRVIKKKSRKKSKKENRVAR